MKSEAFKIILLSRPDFFDSESDIINKFFDSGLEHFHLRKPNANEGEVQSLLDKIQPDHYGKIVMHDHYDLVSKYNLNGVHFPEYIWRSNKNIVIDHVNLGPKEKHCSASLHQLEDLETLEACDYVFLSPILNSISKPNYQSPFILSLFPKLLNKISLKVIALGGMRMKKIGLIKDLGFAGAAFLGDIWFDNNPLNKMEQLLEGTTNYKLSYSN